METTTLYEGYVEVICGKWKRKWKLLHYMMFFVLSGDNGKENGNYYIT